MRNEAWITVNGRKLSVTVGSETELFGKGDVAPLREWLLNLGVESILCSSDVDRPGKTATALRKMLEQACGDN